MPPIYLFDSEFRIFTAASKKRPGPRLEKSLRASLDPAGLTLLDRVLASQFDEADTGALQRAHLLAIPWGPSLDRHPDLQTCLAVHHPRVLQLFCSDVSRLLITLTRAHASPSDTEALAHLGDLEHQLDGLTRDLPEGDFRPLYKEVSAPPRPPFSAGPAAGIHGQVCKAMVMTVLAWHRPLGTRPEKHLGGDARVIELAVESAFEHISKPHKHLAKRWTFARLRERLEGEAGPIVVPPEMLP